MPAPSAEILMGTAISSIPNTLNPQASQKLANAMSKVIAGACGDFLHRVFMGPGVLCVVTPPAMVGTIAGMGRLTGSSPSEQELRLNAMSAISSSGMSKHGQDSFVETISKMTAKGLAEFMTLAQVLPGTPITGGVTAAPAKLTVPIPAVKGRLEAMKITMMPVPGAAPTVSELPSDFPGIVVKVLISALEQMAQLLMVAPGLPVAANQTVGPGKLM